VGHRSWIKANSPYWSNHAATWYAGHQSIEEYCRRRDISTTSLQRWSRHLLSSEELHKRKKRLENLRIKELDRQGKKPPTKRSRKAYTYRYNMRTDSEPIAVRAFWGMHVEAMNWSGMGNAEYAAALGLSPYALRIWRNRFADSGEEMDWRSLLHPSARAQLSSAASCVRRKYRLTPQEADGRSSRRRFSEEQKRAIVQETEKPGVSVLRCAFGAARTCWVSRHTAGRPRLSSSGCSQGDKASASCPTRLSRATYGFTVALIASGSVNTATSNTTLPLASTTQIAVSSMPTSRPQKNSFARLPRC
jgi:transposase-like protein